MINTLTAEERQKYASGARWVAQYSGASASMTDEITNMFEILAMSLPLWTHSLVIEDLWPGLDLEVLVVPPRVGRCTTRPAKALVGNISEAAFELCGKVAWQSLVENNDDIWLLKDDGGTTLVVYLSHVRAIVLKGMCIDLLECAE